MKRYLTIILLFVQFINYGQLNNGTTLVDSISTSIPPIITITKAGSCGSPDGPMNSTIITPPDYPWLQTNGYCNPLMYGNNPTVCWTLTPTSTSVSINSGFSTDCDSYTFSNFNLYDATCTLIGTGLNYSGLTIGSTYTWCMTANSWNFDGTPCDGFLDFCPYYFNNSALPIELISFFVTNQGRTNDIIWMSASEINNDYYTLENSIDGYTWNIITTISGAGNSNSPLVYSYEDNNYTDTLNYYRLTQTDYDGVSEIFEIISIDNNVDKTKLIKTLNLMGQEVDSNEKGFLIEIYDDGTTKKIFKE